MTGMDVAKCNYRVTGILEKKKQRENSDDASFASATCFGEFFRYYQSAYHNVFQLYFAK